MLDVGHILFVKTDPITGAIIVSIGDAKSAEVFDSEATVWQNWGWLSLPSNPTAGVDGAECFFDANGDANQVIGGRDVRSASIAGLIKPGESCAYASGSQACTLWKNDNSITQYTTHDGTSNGRAIYYSVAPTGFDEAWPWGRRFFDQSGHHFIHASGAQMHLGSMSGPAPLDTFGSYFSVTAAMARINASFVTVGPDTAVYSPVARADAVLSTLQAIQAAVSAIASTVTEMAATPAAVGSAPTVNPLVVAALASQVTALTAATASLTAAVVGTAPLPGPIGSTSLVVA